MKSGEPEEGKQAPEENPEGDEAPTIEELQRRIREAAEAGRIEFAPEPDDAYELREVFARFCKEILGISEHGMVYASEETSLLDFRVDREEVLAAIVRVYGVDCSDITDLNFWAVLRRLPRSLQ